RKLLKKDHPSEQILFEMFYGRVYRTAYMIVKDHHLAQDVVQETFAKAFNQLHRLKDPEKTGAWLGTIATTTAIDMIRKRNRWIDVVTEDVYVEWELSSHRSNSVEAEVERAFLIKSIRSHIFMLNENHKQVMILKYIHDMTDAEIAEELGIKIGTVKSRIFR